VPIVVHKEKDYGTPGLPRVSINTIQLFSVPFFPSFFYSVLLNERRISTKPDKSFLDYGEKEIEIPGFDL
jgi:hypothetical protein